jgi:hypothetical protein
MQTTWGRPFAGARAGGFYRQCGRLCALVLGLAASACANIGQIGNLTEGPKVTVAFESVDGAPPAVFQKYIAALKDEAGTRQMMVTTPGEANYRLRGYLAAPIEGGALAWAWDVYDTNQRRVFRLNGTEKGAGITDDQLLRRVARAGMDQFAVFAAARPSAVGAADVPPVEKRSAMFGWIDDWAPETAGIFRIFRRETRPPEMVDAGLPLPPAGEVPLPSGRPAPGAAAEQALAFAADQ